MNIQDLKGLPPWALGIVLAGAGAAALLYIRNSSKEGARTVYSLAPEQEITQDTSQAYYESALTEMGAKVDQLAGQVKTINEEVNTVSTSFDNVLTSQINMLNQEFRNTTEAILSDLKEYKGQIVARPNVGDMSQGTGGTPGQNHDNAMQQHYSPGGSSVSSGSKEAAESHQTDYADYDSGQISFTEAVAKYGGNSDGGIGKPDWL